MPGPSGARGQRPRRHTARRGCAPDRAAGGHDRIAAPAPRVALRLTLDQARGWLRAFRDVHDAGISEMPDFGTARQKMVDGQVRPSDVTDIRIIEAMLEVPREAFVPESRRALAYLDLDLDVSEGGAKRFLIKPAGLAKMLQAAGIGESDNVLVVGCATGYAAAVMAKLAGRVCATESDAALAAKAGEILARLGFGNVSVGTGAAADGDQASAPYDVIVLAGATEMIPDRLYRQL